jgi:uncharacterized membrane protein YphA (DoxX/SURF4 family)
VVPEDGNALAGRAVTCITFPAMPPSRHPAGASEPGTLRLPGSIIQGILARGALVFLRLYLGIVFLVAAIPKLEGNAAQSVRAALLGGPPGSGYGFYQSFMDEVVVPHLELVAGLISWAELLVGFLLVVGLATRLSASIGLLLLINYMLAKGTWFGQPSSSDAALAALAIALIIGAAGRTGGLDALLARRWPRSPLW